MSRPASLTVRHLIIAVLVVVVVNAQLTWWIVFIIRQSRTVLDLEREHLVELCHREARRIESGVELAEIAALQSSTRPPRAAAEVSAVQPGAPGDGTGRVPAPFARAALERELTGVPGWHGDPMEVVWFEFTCPETEGMCGLVARPDWTARLLDVGDEIELAPASSVGAGPRPAVRLVAPFADLVLRPPADVWQQLLETYRRRIVMMASEGAFFAVLLVVLVGLLWRILRREVELERRYRNFLSAITHELKSPLAAIRLSLETVATGRADVTMTQRFVGNALVDTDRLERLVTKVLQATRYDSGTAVLHRRKVDLTDIVRRTLADFEPRIAAAGATLVADLAPGVRTPSADPEAVAIVVSNLVENALTYGGRPAEIRVRLGTKNGSAVLEVSDNGAGIDDDDLPHVFDRFYRSGDEMTRTGQGTGLGLYLVQRIVKAHDGTVAVAATGDGGTTLRVTLPGVEPGEARQ
ncbi:MAG: HAMP domain-containing sensor histidine kinase [Holophagae bacterium]